jgi:uncharacterized protein (TIGR02001 family)
MKKLIIFIFMFSMMTSSASAEEGVMDDIIPGEFSGTVSFITDYTFRGISQTGEGVALQGSIDYSHESGIYLGAWGSNVDFGANDDADLEIDFYGGYTYEIKGFDINAGMIYYSYPGVEDNLDYDFYEYQGAIAYDFDYASITGSVNYSPNNFGDSGKAAYYMLQLDVPLLKNLGIVNEPVTKALEIIEKPVKNYGLLTKAYGFVSDNVGLTAHVGRQLIEKNNTFGTPDYTDWSVGAQFNIEGFDMALQYIDTNLGKADCADGCDSKAVFSISRSF